MSRAIEDFFSDNGSDLRGPTLEPPPAPLPPRPRPSVDIGSLFNPHRHRDSPLGAPRVVEEDEPIHVEHEVEEYDDDDDEEDASNSSSSADHIIIPHGARASAPRPPPVYVPLAQIQQRGEDRLLNHARMRLASNGVAHGNMARRSACYLCSYGHRGIDAAGGPGFALHGELVRLIQRHLVADGPYAAAAMAARFFAQEMAPVFRRAGVDPPLFVVEEVFVHLSTTRHTKNPVVFINTALDRMGAVAELLGDEVYEAGKGCNVAKAREMRMQFETMLRFSREDVTRMTFAAPAADGLQIDVAAHLGRMSLMSTPAEVQAAPAWLFADDGTEA